MPRRKVLSSVFCARPGPPARPHRRRRWLRHWPGEAGVDAIGIAMPDVNTGISDWLAGRDVDHVERQLESRALAVLANIGSHQVEVEPIGALNDFGSKGHRFRSNRRSDGGADRGADRDEARMYATAFRQLVEPLPTWCRSTRGRQ